jgi:hypothetical protein
MSISTWSGTEELKVTVKSFSISGSPRRPSMLHMYGQVSRQGVICRFELRVGGRKPGKLEFSDATIFDGSDPKETAIAVKRVLMEFMRSSDDVPPSMRDFLLEAILKHHEQVR